MTLLDCWIVIGSAAWTAIAAQVPPGSRYCYSQAITGFWKQSVYNVLGTQAEIQPLLDLLGNPTCYAWMQGDGLDSLDQWPTDPSGVLALMKDHVEYDASGNVIGTTPATLDAPNWGHVFLGQAERIFAGDFSNQFSPEFF